MSPLVRAALDVLEDPAAPEGLRSVAGTALLTALNARVEVPPKAPMVVWQWLLRCGGGTHLLYARELRDAEVARDAVRILTSDADAGDDARDLAMAVLRDENLSIVTDADILLLAEQLMDDRRMRRFCHLVEAIHELNGLAPDFLTMLRDRLVLSTQPSVRAAGVEVGALLPRLDEHFAERMLTDTSPMVRRTLLEVLERAEAIDRAKAATLVRRHLGSEHHRTALATGLTTLGSLVRHERGGDH